MQAFPRGFVKGSEGARRRPRRNLGRQVQRAQDPPHQAGLSTKRALALLPRSSGPEGLRTLPNNLPCFYPLLNVLSPDEVRSVRRPDSADSADPDRVAFLSSSSMRVEVLHRPSVPTKRWKKRGFERGIFRWPCRGSTGEAGEDGQAAPASDGKAPSLPFEPTPGARLPPGEHLSRDGLSSPLPGGAPA